MAGAAIDGRRAGRVLREPGLGHRGRRGIIPIVAVAALTSALPLTEPRTAAAAAAEPVLTWARSATQFERESVGRGIVVDQAGNTIVTGSFEDRATFGDGDRAVELVSRGFIDLFVAKYDPDGELLWATSGGSTSFDEGSAVDVDGAGNVYVAGEFFAAGQLGSSPVPSGAFLARFGADGSLSWVRAEAGLFGVDDVAVDTAGNAYVTGAYSRTTTFGAGSTDPVTLSPRTDGRPVAARDVFLAAYEPDGDLRWVRDAGGVDQDEGMGVDVNDAGDVALSGTITGPATFGVGSGAVTLPAYGSFVAMYTSSGDVQWARAGESGTFAEARDVAVDSAGRASAVGQFFDSITFATDGAPLTLTTAPFSAGVFLATFAADGTLEWATTGSTDQGFPDGWAVATDGSSVVIAGEFSGESITFGDGGDAVTLDNVNSSADVFLASYTAGGTLEWAQADGGEWSESAYDVALAPDSIAVTGQYQFMATFGSDADQVTLGTANSLEEPAFVARYSTAGGVPTRIVVPSRLSRTGSATVRVVGAGLVAGTTFDLVGPGGAVLTPTRSSVKPSEQEVEARFELLNAPLGAWTVRLNVPGEGETQFPGAITVVEPGSNDDNPLWLSLSMRDTVRVGRPFLATLSVGNRTDRDLAGVPLVIEGLPPGTEVTPRWNDLERTTDPLPGMPPPAVPSEIPLLIDDGNGTLMLPILTGRIPANGRSDLPVEITFPPGTSGALNVTASGCQPTGASGTIDPVPAPGDPPAGPGGPSADCLKEVYTAIVEQALEVVPGSGCVADAAKGYVAEQIVEWMFYRQLGAASQSDPGSAKAGTDVTEDVIDFVASCLAEAVPGNKAIKAAELMWQIYQAVTEAEALIESCTSHLPPSSRRVSVVNSRDPNDKVGPDGFGEQGFTTPDVPFDYSIYFENVESASAAAQQVVITDIIDTTTFDPATIELGAITVANTIVAVPPPGLREWSDVVEFGQPDLLLGIDVSYEEATGTMTWTLETLDRETGLPTDDPLAGFLPPNVDAPEGEGSVRFLVEPRSRTDGTVLSNEATIVFDVNEPIATGPWTNTLDGTAPASSVAALPELTGSTDVPLSWTATDATSGVGPVEIWVQRDAEPPGLWRVAADPAVNSETFVGIEGSTYAFWTRAWDRAGNVEAPPGLPDAVTTIRLNRPPVASGQQLSTDEDTDLPITLTAADPDGEPVTFEVVDQPAHGTLLGTAPDLTYRPTPGFSGADSFTFRVSDGELVSAPVTVAIDVVDVVQSSDAIALEILGPRQYANSGDVMSGDFEIRTDRHGVVSARGAGTIAGRARRVRDGRAGDRPGRPDEAVRRHHPRR